MEGDGGTTWTLLHILTGCSELKAINAQIIHMRGGNSDITILPNVNTLQCILNVVGAKVKVSFDVPNSLASVLGFNRTTTRCSCLPTIMSGLATGLLSGGFHKAIIGTGVVGDGLYLHKHDKCYRVQKLKGNGLYLAPHPRFVESDGLFLKPGNDISDGAGLLMGKNSLFKNIPVLGMVIVIIYL